MLAGRLLTVPSDKGANARTAIEYSDAVCDEQSGQWISRAEVAEGAEVSFTAFSSRKSDEQVEVPLVLRTATA
jgi:hypothetical protein